MKVAICALAKGENAYIGDWVSHHVSIGYTDIYLYDNNQLSDAFVGDFIPAHLRPKVHIIDIRTDQERMRYNMVPHQCQLYTEFIAKHCHEWDWCTFIDIDEYVVTPDIGRLLSSMPDECNFMVLNWLMYSDGDELDGDECVPVRQRLTQLSAKDGYANRVVKSTVRGGNPLIKAATPHSFWFGTRGDSVYYNCYGQIVSTTPLGSVTDVPCHAEHYIAHYPTKTLGEFLRHKAPRLEGRFCSPQLIKYYFFRTNRRTPEKERMIDEYCRANGIKNY